MMKTLIAALVLASASSVPAFAMEGSVWQATGEVGTVLIVPGDDGFGRRSGLCPKRAVAREGSTCGGV